MLLTTLFSGCISLGEIINGSDVNTSPNTSDNLTNNSNVSTNVSNETNKSNGTNETNGTNDTNETKVCGICGEDLRPTTRVNVSAFNIQIFGASKASNAEVMDVLAKTIRNYDIIGVQEIRDASGESLPKLVQLVNSGTDENGTPYNYDYVVSSRLGRSSSKEQYAYIYNKDKVYVASEPITYPEPDGADPFEREPYMVTFRSNIGNFDAVFILIHTKPDDAKAEINELNHVVEYAKTIYVGQENYVIMGDFNADGSYFNESGSSDLKSEKYVWLIGNNMTTTTKTNNTYDRIVITKSLEPYVTGNLGVYNYSAAYGLNATQTTAVSDHYPVYAEFFAWVAEWGRMLFIKTESGVSA
ncbi:endonuclease/exonuclease/phosphatase family protein [Methanolapillus ohkumae]